ncbi:hypothetical protein CMZ84_09620 [Lysobacteraceae bacterium NML93-0399]|nr:hypothetical protein CMZ84_09620 [Xanthomonadaceae bacterium NML93-0399]
MGSRLKAKVQPSVLVWARESAGYTTVGAAADAIGVAEDTLGDWETGFDAPSIPQLRKLAEQYKRPLAVMYLPEPPTKFLPMRDFRRMPGTTMQVIPPAIVVEERRAHQRRELALELAADLEDPIQPFTMAASMDENPETVGDRVREELGVTDDLQRSWRDQEGRSALNGWRQRIEAKGVLVFQSDKFSADEASGFAIWAPVAPVVVVARKATPPRRRTFSLLHEFAHLLVRASGLSDLEIDGDSRRPPEEQRIEVFCNAVAAAALLPKRLLMQHRVVVSHQSGEPTWGDEELSEIGRSFGASREAVLRRLLTFKMTTADFYKTTRTRYQDEWVQYRERQKASSSDGMKRNMPQETLTNLGRPFIGMVLERYHQDRLSLSEVAGYLGLKTKHIIKIDHMMRGVA